MCLHSSSTRSSTEVLKMKPFVYYLKLFIFVIVSISVVDCQNEAPVPATEQTTILWSLAPCQSSFWVPSTSSEFNQNWITYQYDGNPLSQSGECIFSLESEPNTRIEMIIQQVHLFGNGLLTIPPPCLLLYDVKMDGSIVLLKKECNIILSFNQFESFSTFTDTNLAIISSTIRYGSFQLRARAVPKNYGFPPQVSPTTAKNPAIDATPVITINPPSSTAPKVTTEKMPTVITVMPQNPTSPTRYFNRSMEYANMFEEQQQLPSKL